MFDFLMEIVAVIFVASIDNYMESKKERRLGKVSQGVLFLIWVLATACLVIFSATLVQVTMAELSLRKQLLLGLISLCFSGLTAFMLHRLWRYGRLLYQHYRINRG
ncbi:Uncharacterised protein [Streptococcus merionis]|uniref:Uncharacterized protein n=2 Tax=Streptococcus merionis TaxID=400065 RepID=A0A239SQF7_9STRE|nr:Uncharacterised protein [Streptococcus merionis]